MRSLRKTMTTLAALVLWTGLLWLTSAQDRVSSADDKATSEWQDLSTLSAWRKSTGWKTGGGASLQASNSKLLTTESGEGVLVDETGTMANLYSKTNFGPIELELEFMVSKGSNSGVKFLGKYEIQIHDSFGKNPIKAQDCGGIYPKAELLPRYRYLDEGVPPKVNASKPAGEWQTLHATFLPPQFDAKGQKTANAKIVKATLNGQVIHENLELAHPTGHAWKDKEIAKGPLMLQADHGPVAFRKIRVRAIENK